MTSRILLVVCAGVAAAVGCSSSGDSVSTGATSGAGTTAGAGGSTTTANASVGGTTSSSGGGSAASSGTQGSGGGTGTGGGGSGGAAACPDVTGAYSVTDVGMGCADLNTKAPQCIKAGNAVCAIDFVSGGPGSVGAVNGVNIALQMDGSFSGAAVTFGSQARSGCVGTWDANAKTMAVNCGGMNPSSQMCTATLTRTGTCP